MALVAAFGCSDEPRQAETRTQAEMQAEQAFLERLGEPVPPPDYEGPAPKWWWLEPESAKNLGAPDPDWWKKAPLCEIEPEVTQPETALPEPAPPIAEKAKPKKKQAAVKTPRPKRPRISATPKTIAEAQRDFEAFAKLFVDKMARNLRHTAENKEVVKTAGGYRARFIHLEKDTVTVEVKPCEGPASYVGLMKYLEGHYQNECATEACAMDGPFKLIKKVRTTEIFRYAGGRWQ
jgi:hypothetical protein